MDQEEIEQWSPAARDRMASAAKDIVEAIQVHVRTLLAMKGRQSEIGEIFRSCDALGRTACLFADAQLDLTGIAAPFGLLAQRYEGREDEEESEATVADAAIGEGLSILRRDDYIVVDPESVLAEGRRSYLNVWPKDNEEDAASDVTTLGQALYQVAHAAGWDALTNLSGLQPTAKVTWAIQAAEVMGGAAAGWPDDPFCGDHRADNIIYRQKDAFSG